LPRTRARNIQRSAEKQSAAAAAWRKKWQMAACSVCALAKLAQHGMKTWRRRNKAAWRNDIVAALAAAQQYQHEI